MRYPHGFCYKNKISQEKKNGKVTLSTALQHSTLVLLFKTNCEFLLLYLYLSNWKQKDDMLISEKSPEQAWQSLFHLQTDTDQSAPASRISDGLLVLAIIL